jgi:hypothetical protein
VPTAKWMVLGPVDLAHSKKFPLHQRHLKKTNCWMRDLWMLIGPVAGATPLARLQNHTRPQSCCRSGPLLRNSRCSKPFQISALGTGTPALLRTHITDCLYIFQLLKAGRFTDSFVYFYISDSRCTPFYKRAFLSVGKSAASSDLYLFV